MSSVIKQGIYDEECSQFIRFIKPISLDVIRTNPNVDFFRDEKIQELMVKIKQYVEYGTEIIQSLFIRLTFFFVMPGSVLIFVIDKDSTKF